jgi:hypothetical protein
MRVRRIWRAARSESDLTEALRLAMRELGIGKLVVVELLGADAPAAGEARVLFSAVSAEPERPPPSRESFPPRQIAPVDAGLDGDTASWVALPLFHRSRALGYLLAELGLDDGKAYESLRVHVSACLWALRHAT